MPPTYIVLTTLGMGGAEKRFIELFRALAERGVDIRLVVPEATLDQFLLRSDAGSLAGHSDRIIRFGPRSGSMLDVIRSLRPIVRSIPRGSVVHYPLAHFPVIHGLRGHRLVISWVGAFLPRFQWNPTRLRYLGLLWLGLAEARLIDVLNPLIRDRLARYPLLARKLRVTAGGTFVDADHFRPGPKRNKVAFLGRVEAEKGALRFGEAALVAAPNLRQAGIEPEFAIYGNRGDQLDAVRELIADHPDIPVSLGYAADPQPALSDAKVFVSLQQSSNYPSKALAEAMACGCVPIITDVGESRLMIDDELAEFIQPDFTAAQLAEAIGRVLSLPPKSFERRSQAVRDEARKRFRIEVQADYFERLYEEAAR